MMRKYRKEVNDLQALLFQEDQNKQKLLMELEEGKTQLEMMRLEQNDQEG